MSDEDLGGDPPCWAHLLDDEDAAGASANGCGPLVVDLGAARSGSGGAIWSLPHGGDLDANLVRLDPGAAIGSHVNIDVDVLLLVQSGTGELIVDGQARRVDSRPPGPGPEGVAALDRGRRRRDHLSQRPPSTQPTRHPTASGRAPLMHFDGSLDALSWPSSWAGRPTGDRVRHRRGPDHG